MSSHFSNKFYFLLRLNKCSIVYITFYPFIDQLVLGLFAQFLPLYCSTISTFTDGAVNIGMNICQTP